MLGTSDLNPDTHYSRKTQAVIIGACRIGNALAEQCLKQGINTYSGYLTNGYNDKYKI